MSPLFSQDLPPLDNVLNTISVEPMLNDTDIDELRESIYLVIDDFVTKNVREYKYSDFRSRIFDHTYEIIEMLYNQIDDFAQINITEFIEEGIYAYFEIYGVKRSEPTKVTTPRNIRRYSRQLTSISKKDSHEQGTLEWFQFRWNHITASSAWQALEGEGTQNQLILSKCKPISPYKGTSLNINAPTHHGHKFEPLSTLLYEYTHNTVIGEFGCIESDTYPYLAASPDGINTKIGNPRFGRLLEIKNPTTRPIIGVPKKEYWVQMQLQMEVLDLDECDFFETSFKEYKDIHEFKNEGSFHTTTEGKLKGVILCFNDGNKPVYKYMPFNIKTSDDFNEWRDKTIDDNSNLTWIMDSYWWLNASSCVLVRRNKKWFDSEKQSFEEIWSIILKERDTGFEHRKPRKRKKRSRVPALVIRTPPLIPQSSVNNTVLKVRTQSLDNAELVI